MTRINPQRINMHKSYTVKELSILLDIVEKTCIRWIQSGLKTVGGNRKPFLILGSEAKEFIGKKNSKNKGKMNRNQFFCFQCKCPTYAKKGSQRIRGDKKLAICSVCKGKISRTFKPYQKDYKISSPPIQMSLLLP